MNQPATSDPAQAAEFSEAPPVETVPTHRPPSYVKLAMRNMVRKGGTSLYHFALTTLGLLALLVGLAYLTH
jgi:Protein of unknown function (DUF3285)